MLRTEKEKILVKVPCREEVRRKFYQRFGEKCEFVFTEDYSGDVAECKTLKSREEFLQNCLRDAEVIIGEPDEAELQQAENLKWLQITWAGADKYTKMQNIRRDFVLTNASGAFGIVISEYHWEYHCPVSFFSGVSEKTAKPCLGKGKFCGYAFWEKGADSRNRRYREECCRQAATVWSAHYGS